MIRRVGDVWVVFYLGTVGDRLPRFPCTKVGKYPNPLTNHLYRTRMG